MCSQGDRVARCGFSTWMDSVAVSPHNAICYNSLGNSQDRWWLRGLQDTPSGLSPQQGSKALSLWSRHSVFLQLTVLHTPLPVLEPSSCLPSLAPARSDQSVHSCCCQRHRRPVYRKPQGKRTSKSSVDS
eukprot:3666025-Amphidinium_carterae.1